MQEAVIGSSRSPRSVRTLRLLLTQAEEQQELMDAQRKIEIGQRIKELREDSPYPQPAIARAVGVSLRAVQKWEAGKGIGYDNAERLAQFHGVSVDYILKGTTPATPNLLGVLDGDSQLNRVEQKLDDVLSRLDALAPQLDQLEDQVRLARAEHATDAAEALKRNEELLRAIRRPRPGQQ